jgi:hypothetical protein
MAPVTHGGNNQLSKPTYCLNLPDNLAARTGSGGSEGIGLKVQNVRRALAQAVHDPKGAAPETEAAWPFCTWSRARSWHGACRWVGAKGERSLRIPLPVQPNRSDTVVMSHGDPQFLAFRDSSTGGG